MTKEELRVYVDILRSQNEISYNAYSGLIDGIDTLEQEPCEDCISRKVATKAICEDGTWLESQGCTEITMVERKQRDADILGELLSVTPQPKVGEWLEKEVNSDKVIEEWQSARCSVCDKYHTTPYMYYFDNYKFCPNCGAQMKRRQKVDKGRSKRNR